MCPFPGEMGRTTVRMNALNQGINTGPINFPAPFEDLLAENFSPAEVEAMRAGADTVDAQQAILEGIADAIHGDLNLAGIMGSFFQRMLSSGEHAAVDFNRDLQAITEQEEQRQRELAAPVVEFLKDKEPAFQVGYLMKLRDLKITGEIIAQVTEILLIPPAVSGGVKALRLGGLVFKNARSFRRAVRVSNRLRELHRIRTGKTVIKGTQYSPEYYKELKKTDRLFRDHGIEVSEHALNRFIGRQDRGISFNGVVDSYKNGTTFSDPLHGTEIRFKNGIAVSLDRKSKKIVNVQYQKKPTERWQLQ